MKTEQQEIEELQERCENLETVILDLMSIIIDNKEVPMEDFAFNVGGDISDLKSDFENLIADY